MTQPTLILDIKYLSFISSRLKRFKKTDTTHWVCRCPLCGDSKKSETKTRGNFYPYKGSLFYNCYNCGETKGFSTFLKDFDGSLYKEYLFEKFKDEPKPEVKQPLIQPIKSTKLDNFVKSDLDLICSRLDSLKDDHEVILYAKSRKLPEAVYRRLYYCKSIKDLIQIFPEYQSQVKTDESRLVLPFYDFNKNLIGVAARAIHGESLRYFNFKLKDADILLFGTKEVDLDKNILITEGPIDSLFLPNCIALAGLSVSKLNKLPINKKQRLLILDNQPRNREVVKVYEGVISNGENIFIPPKNWNYKDINDAILGGLEVTEILKTIRDNMFSGISAKLAFSNWRKI